MAITGQDRATMQTLLGVEDQPGLGMGYPELKALLGRLFEDRVSKLPWVPSSWLGAVKDIQAKNPTDLIRIAPARNVAGQRQAGAPSFATSPEMEEVWMTIYKAQQDAIVSYAAQQVEIGRRKLDALTANAAFWNAAYNVADFAKNLPAQVVSKTFGGVSDFVGTFLPESIKAYSRIVLWMIIALVAGGLVLWYRKRVAAVVKGFRKGAA